MTGRNILSQNLDWLQTRTSPESRRFIANGGPGSPYLTAEPRSDGLWDFVWQDNERKITLHSRRDPMAEAARQAAEAVPDPAADGCIVAGFAGMHHLKTIAAKLRRDATLIVIDLDPAMVFTVLNCCDLRELDQFHLRCLFIFNPEVDAAKREFRQMLKKIDRLNFTAFVHPAMLRITPVPYQQLIEEIGSEIRLETTDRITRASLAEEWLMNAIDGLPFSLRNPDVAALKDKFTGATAVIAAAGPSLDRTIPFLRHLAPHCLVFAVGTALKPLLAAGIEPDFIVALDSDPVTLRQLPETGMDNLMLLAAHSIPPEMAARFAARRFSFSFSGMKGFNRRLATAGFPPTILNVGGTVSLTAIDTALLTGCSSVILCGLDLAMAEDGTTHAKNSMYDGCRAESPQLVAVRGNYEKKVFTSPQFAGYIKQMNAYLADMTVTSQTMFYNATDSGAFFDNTILVKPEDIEKTVKINAIAEKKRIIVTLHQAEQRADAGKFAAQAVNEMRQLATDAAKAERCCRQLLRQREERTAQKTAGELDRLDRQIKANPGIDVVEPALENVLLAMRNNNTGTVNVTDRLENGRKLYSAIADAAEKTANKFENILKSL